MPENVKLNRKLGIIEVVSQGKVSYEDSLSSLERIQELMDETGVKLIMTDTRKQDFQPNIIKVYEFAKRLPMYASIALISSPTQTTADSVEFLDNAASNRGVKLKRFKSRKDAIAWLQDTIVFDLK